MLRTIFSFGLLVSVFAVQSQTVFIPDPQLRVKLNAWSPGLVDVNGYMPEDSQGSTPAILDLVVDWYPADLAGLYYLNGVTEVNIEFTEVEEDGVFQMPQFAEHLSVTHLLNGMVWGENVKYLHAHNMNWISPYEGLIELVFTGLLPTLPIIEFGTTTLQLLSIEGDLSMISLYDFPNLDSLQLPVGINGVTLENVGLGQLHIPDMSGFDPAVNVQNMDSLISISIGSNSIFVALTNLPLVESVAIGQASAVEISDLPYLTTVAMEGGDLLNLSTVGPLEDLSECNATNVEITASTMSSFPALPDGLQADVYISNCPELTSIEGLPSTLLGFGVSHCPELVFIEAFPIALLDLHVGGNAQLYEIPELPNALQSLYVGDLMEIIGPVQCLPTLPESLTQLTVNTWYQHISCLPNHPAGLVEPPLPICNIVSSSCPDAEPSITGQVYRDDNGNGVKDPVEPGIPNAIVIAMPFERMAWTDQNGYYIMKLPLGDHTVTAGNNVPSILNQDPMERLVLLDTLGQLIPGQDFGIQVNLDVQDLSVSLNWNTALRPGFTSIAHVRVTNLGYDFEVVPLHFSIEPELILQECDYEPTITSSGLEWDLGTITFGQSVEVKCKYQVPVGMTLGSEVVTIATVSPNDADTNNNVVIRTDTIVGSFDPNDKQVFPSILSPDEGITGREVEYLIRFQNTGTYLAERVLITDTLSTDLIAQSLEFVASSHPCTWFYREGALHILFEEIMLPDSNSNEPESHGFALFRIDTRDQLLVGDQIDNIANIYFDFNEPVITEPAVLSVVLPTAVEAHATIDAIVHPVPSSGLIEISHDGAWNGAPITIRDLKGNVVMRGNVRDRKEMIDISSLASGIYVIDLVKDGRTWSKRIVKE